MLSSTRLRHLEYTQGICLTLGILISGLFGCTSISAPKFIKGNSDASGGSSGADALGGGTSGRDAGGGGGDG